MPLQRLIRIYQESFLPPKKREFAPIHVDEIASKVAYLYERIRKIIDWKEENLLRRSAIERILKRHFIFEVSGLDFIFKVKIEEVAESLVLELVRGGHLPNDTIPRDKIFEVDKIVKKYLFLLKNAPYPRENSSFPLKERVNFYDWILEVAACEIEEVLTPPLRENALIETMTALMAERIRLTPQELLNEEEKLIQTYIACHRTLFDLDDAIITYHLLKYHYAQWIKPDEIFLKDTAKNIFLIKKEIENELSHPLGKEFFNICEKTDTIFVLLDDILCSFKENPAAIPQVFSDKETFVQLLTNFYQKRLVTLKSRLFKLAVFSTLSVFVANWFTFFIVEVPLASIFYEGFNLIAALTDFIVPTLAMFFLVSIIRPPSMSNLKEVIRLALGFVYPQEQKDIYEIRIKKKRKTLTNFIIIFLYVLACIIFFFGVAWVFYKASIPITSVIFDTLTIAINIFAALVIRNKARELTVEEKTGFWEFLLDIMTLPVAKVGSWFARKWKEYNVVAIFFNVVIETPFVTFIEFIENWREYLKEKKAEIH